MSESTAKELTLKEEQKLVKIRLKTVKKDTKKIQKMLKSGQVSVDEWDMLQSLTDDEYYEYLHTLVTGK